MPISILEIIREQDEEYDALHTEYWEAKKQVDNDDKDEWEREEDLRLFLPIQQEFLRNRHEAVPTEVWQIIASMLKTKERLLLSCVDTHMHDQVIFGKYSGVFVWETHEYIRFLHLAAEKGHINLARIFIDMGKNVDSVYSYRRPIHKAIKFGHVQMVRMLIDKGACVNITQDHEIPPLFIAIRQISKKRLKKERKPYIEIIKMLIGAGAKVDEEIDFEKTMLQCVVSDGDNEVVRLLIQAGANVKHRDINNTTPLHLAIYPSTVKLLLEANANVNAQTVEGSTPLYQAVFHNRTDVVRELIDAGADVNLADNDGETPLEVANWRCRMLSIKNGKMFKMLQKAGAQ